MTTDNGQALDVLDLPAHRQAELLRAGSLTPIELFERTAERIVQVNPQLNAYTRTSFESGRAQAHAAQATLAAGQGGPLTGLPVGLKDIFLTRGIETTCCSNILRGYIPPYDGTATARCLEAGSPLLGKLNMDEFAMGSSNETSAWGPVHNPWAHGVTPGGSSGGSAAAVAAGLCSYSLGTDTGGSIRLPAAFTGIVGLKPTYGRVSRFGVIAFASSLDQVGPMTRDVRDAARVLQTIAGHDPMDATSVDVPVPDYEAALSGAVKGLRIGVPVEFFGAGIDPEVRAATEAALDVYRQLGATTVEVSLPNAKYSVAVYYIVATAEASSNLARYDGVRYGSRADASNLLEMYTHTREAGFGLEVKRRIMLGTFVLSHGYFDAYYKKAQQVRTLIREDFDRAFERCDVIAGPTSPLPPFKLGEKLADPLAMYLMDVLTIPCNLAGLPGLSVPCGFTQSGLPLGLQLLGRPFDEAGILNAAYAYEQATPWHTRRPKLAA
jgi:aspartyl-tRNA(Asn)/glutamyl-tRNA(Gln) amidotransferase subunit A